MTLWSYTVALTVPWYLTFVYRPAENGGSDMFLENVKIAIFNACNKTFSVSLDNKYLVLPSAQMLAIYNL